MIQTPISQEHTGHFLFPVCFKKKKRWGDHITDITQQLAFLFNPFKDIWICFQVSEHWCDSCVFQRWLIIHRMCILGFISCFLFLILPVISSVVATTGEAVIKNFVCISLCMADGIIDSTDVSLSKLREIVKDREIWRAAVHGVEETWT